MPIDFAAIAARFAVAFAAQLKNAVTAQKSLEKALGRRRDAARLVDRATGGFPIVRFYDGAVSLVLPPNQRALLTLATPPLSVGQGLAAGGHDFLDGLALATAPLRGDSQETAIARFLTGADSALREVEASLVRFEKAGPQMFDPNRRTASDLFGLAALGFRALAEASRRSGELQRLTEQLAATTGVLGMALPVPAAPDGGAAASTRSMAETMDALAYEVVAGIVVIGTLPGLIEDLVTGLVPWLELVVLGELSAIEQHVLDFRAAAFEAVFGGLTRLADRGTHLISGAHYVIAAHVTFELRFLRVFATELAVGVRDFIHGLTEFLGDVVDLVRWLPTLLQAVTGFELTRIGSSALGWVTEHSINVSLDNLLDDDGTGVNRTLQARLNWLIDKFEGALRKAHENRVVRWVAGDYVERGLRAVASARWLVRELFVSGGPTDAIPRLPEAAPLVFHSDFPNLGETFFGAPTRAGVVGGVERIERALRTGVGTALNRTARAFTDLAGEFATEATRSATVDTRLARVAEQSDRLADTVFGPEVAAERRERPEEAVARALESWLATGGFLLVGEVIPGYVAELAAHWRATLAEGTELTAELTPTSPHILRRRATLGKVALPRLTLHGGVGTELDEEFADAVADRFAGAVRDAYETGQRKLAGLAAIGGD
ncbi:hypothetical protein [Actinophytocola sp.]|uniref:hypothetical protein n=1 Tax=Actinophytocola sp. TaxID=1872138 RepID=UPI00389A99AB